MYNEWVEGMRFVEENIAQNVATYLRPEQEGYAWELSL